MDMMLLLKASVLLTAALAGARLLRRAPAATRHGLWSVAFAALLALPFLASLVPSLHVPVPAGWSTLDRGSADRGMPAPQAAATRVPGAPADANLTAVGTGSRQDVPRDSTTPVSVAAAVDSNAWSWPAPGVLLLLVWLTVGLGPLVLTRMCDEPG